MPRPSLFQHHLVQLVYHRIRPLVDIALVFVLGVPLFAIHSLSHPRVLLSWRESQHAFFGGVWSWLAAALDTKYAPYKRSLLSSAKGIVVDVGSGQGENLKYLDRHEVTRLILLEPNPLMHLTLRVAAFLAGFPQAEIVACGIEDAAIFERLTGLREGEVDTFVCFLTLCCVPKPKEVVKRLRTLLKKGGRILFFEHIASHDAATRHYQKRLQPIWALLFDGCQLDRETVGDFDWASKQVETIPGESEKFAFDPKRMGWAQK